MTSGSSMVCTIQKAKRLLLFDEAHVLMSDTERGRVLEGLGSGSLDGARQGNKTQSDITQPPREKENTPEILPVHQPESLQSSRGLELSRELAMDWPSHQRHHHHHRCSMGGLLSRSPSASALRHGPTANEA